MLKQQVEDALAGYASNRNNEFHIHRDREASQSLLISPAVRESSQPHATKTSPVVRPTAPSTLTPARVQSMNAPTHASNGARHQHDQRQPLSPTELRSSGNLSFAKMVSTIRPVRRSEEKENTADGNLSDSGRSTPPPAASDSPGLSAVNGAGDRTSAKGDREAHSPRMATYTLATTTRAKPSAVPARSLFSSSPELAIDISRRDSSRGGAGSSPAPYSPPTAPSGGVRVVSAASEKGVDPGGAGVLGSPDTSLANGWDATVGKAALGKTGRVINRLVSDNEALKRDIQIERLRAEESRQAARLVEDKMERLVSEFEGRLLEANVTKTLLARKERQVESLQAAVEAERRRTAEARDGERMWKEEAERVRDETKKQVKDAVGRATLLEGRYNAISSHWHDQGEEVRHAMSKMDKQVTELGDERRADDERIATLRELCDQQDGNIRELTRQREDLARHFDAYKLQQEEALQGIRDRAVEREAEQEMMLSEAREMLDKLKWALAVKENISWAQ